MADSQVEACPFRTKSSLTNEEQKLLKKRKLILLCNLEKTLVDIIDQNTLEAQGILPFESRRSDDNSWEKCGIRFRPGARWFLRTMKNYFDIYLVTTANKTNAKWLQEILERGEQIFKKSIIIAEEGVNKDDSFRDLFSPGAPLAVKVDYTEAQWQNTSNLLRIQPYSFLNENLSGSLCVEGDTYDLEEVIKRPLMNTEDPRSQKLLSSMITNFEDSLFANYLKKFSFLLQPNTSGMDETSPSSAAKKQKRSSFAEDSAQSKRFYVVHPTSISKDAEVVGTSSPGQPALRTELDENSLTMRIRLYPRKSPARTLSEIQDSARPIKLRLKMEGGSEAAAGTSEADPATFSGAQRVAHEEGDMAPAGSCRSRLPTVPQTAQPDRSEACSSPPTQWKLTDFGYKRTPIEDRDDHLEHTALILLKIHKLFFSVYDYSLTTKIPVTSHLMNFITGK